MLVDAGPPPPMQHHKKYNLYDSWRSDWNSYYYNPSTSRKYPGGGYGSSMATLSRHPSDYDTNF